MKGTQNIQDKRFEKWKKYNKNTRWKLKMKETQNIVDKLKN